MKKQKHISMRLRKKMPLPTKKMKDKNKEESRKECRQNKHYLNEFDF